VNKVDCTHDGSNLLSELIECLLKLFLVTSFNREFLDEELLLALFVCFRTAQALVGNLELNKLWDKAMFDASLDELYVQSRFPQLEVGTLILPNEADGWFAISCSNDVGDGFVGWESETNEEL
jgi:hypothetical protein